MRVVGEGVKGMVRGQKLTLAGSDHLLGSLAALKATFLTWFPY